MLYSAGAFRRRPLRATGRVSSHGRFPGLPRLVPSTAVTPVHPTRRSNESLWPCTRVYCLEETRDRVMVNTTHEMAARAPVARMDEGAAPFGSTALSLGSGLYSTVLLRENNAR